LFLNTEIYENAYKKIRRKFMTINKIKNGSHVTIIPEGRLDTTTAPQLEREINVDIKDVRELDFDFSKLVYISSAGLRVLLSAQKIMNKQGKMTIHNANEDIIDVFEVTGFIDILNIEE